MGIGVAGVTSVDGITGLATRERRVLAALALAAPHSVSRDRLADALWGDDLPDSWIKVVQNSVSRLRHLIGFDAVGSESASYRLNVPLEEIDAIRFERLIALAEDAVAIDPLKSSLHLDEARQLWRGRPYLDLEERAWASASIQRLESRRRALDELQVEVWMAADRLDDAIGVARGLVDAEPADERRAALLATSLYRAGRSVDALKVLQRVRAHLREEFGLDPSPTLVALELAVLSHDATLLPTAPTQPATTPSRPTMGALPAPLSTMFGRREDLARLRRVLASERLVVLAGPGGVGKTRLALAAAAEASPDLSGGARFVELANISDSRDVAPFVGNALGFLPRGGLNPRHLLIDGIGDRELLLVLDNCEHVLDETAGLVRDLLTQCPRLRVLATSRQIFAIDGEHVVPVGPLDVDVDSVDLFIDRASAAGVTIASAQRPQVAEICRHVDGIPLAIELAAARVRTFALDDIEKRLEQRIDIAAGAGRRGPDRHQTMSAALQWSFDLLDEAERVAFCRASVFAGRFDLAAAEEILAGPPLTGDVVEIVAGLVDKSMVLVDSTSPAPFRFLEPVRQFAALRLDELGERANVVRIHAEHYATVVGQLAEQLESPNEIPAARRLDAMRPNLRAAFATAVSSNDVDLALRIVAPLGRYTNLHIWAEPWSWCDEALALIGAHEHPLRAATLVHASYGAWQSDDRVRALALADQAVALCERGSETWRQAQAARAIALTFMLRIDEAIAAAEAGAAPLAEDGRGSNLIRVGTMLLIANLAGRADAALTNELLELVKSGPPSAHAHALHVASLVLELDNPARCIALNEQALELARASGARLFEGFALMPLAKFEILRDPVSGARRQVEVMAHYRDVGNRNELRGFGRAMIKTLVDLGAFEPAAVVDGATPGDSAILLSVADEIAAAVERARAELGPAYDDAMRRGASMTDDELVGYLSDVVSGLTSSRT